MGSLEGLIVGPVVGLSVVASTIVVGSAVVVLPTVGTLLVGSSDGRLVGALVIPTTIVGASE